MAALLEGVRARCWNHRVRSAIACEVQRISAEHNYNETFIARLAAREKQIQQHYRPVISVHKWFARRPGSLFRGLALAELVDERIERSYTDAHALTVAVARKRLKRSFHTLRELGEEALQPA